MLTRKCTGVTMKRTVHTNEAGHSLLMEERSWDMLIKNSSDNSGLHVTNTSGWSKICRMHLWTARPDKGEGLATVAHLL